MASRYLVDSLSQASKFSALQLVCLNMIQPPGQILRQCFLIASPQKENSMWLPFSRFFAQVSFFRAPWLTMYPWKKMELSFCHLLSGNGGMQLKQFLPKNMSNFNGRNAQRGKNVSKTSITSALMAASNIICISSFRQDSKFSYRYSLSWSKEVWKSNLQQHGEMKCRKQERRVKRKKIQARAKW